MSDPPTPSSHREHLPLYNLTGDKHASPQTTRTSSKCTPKRLICIGCVATVAAILAIVLPLVLVQTPTTDTEADTDSVTDTDTISVTDTAADTMSVANTDTAPLAVIQPWPFGSDERYHYIAHGGGAIDNNTYTNSLEAFERSIGFGFKLIEFDLLETADSPDAFLIAAHDWQYLKQLVNYTDASDKPLLFSDLEGYKIHGNYSIVTGGDIVTLLDTYPGMYLVTDKITNYKKVKELGHSDRLFVEVFSKGGYGDAVAMGVQRPMLCVNGWIHEDTDAVRQDSVSVNPKYVTLSAATVETYPGYAQWLVDRGVKLFIYTVNNRELATTLRNKYDAVLYTDYLSPDGGCTGAPGACE
eukprot:GDKI01034487.1.p1 GENE.GDKI01034487.1~~GDKI01034487.1.p1  ORF type:complete len:356 (-),score=73.81 GDKI01034487.1:32-1099(-)